MANILFWGFEHITGTPNQNTLWDITAGGFQYSTTTPRPGGSARYLTGDASARNGIRSLGSNYSHLFMGVGLLTTNIAVHASTSCHFAFMDGATGQIGWKVKTDGAISVHAGTLTTDTTLGTTVAGVITQGTTGADYKMIELEVVFGTGTSGSFILRVAGVEVLNVTGVNTAPSGVAQANRFRMTTEATVGANPRYDDLYINDDTGSAPENGFFGEAFVVEPLLPTGNGNSSQWLGSDGNSTDNFQLVDDNGNGDTDYVASGTLNDLDLYAFGNLVNAAGTVIGVNHYLVARKDDVATRTIASAIRTNSTDFVGSDKTMTGSYAICVETRLVNPDTALRFTISEVNALEAGQKVTT